MKFFIKTLLVLFIITLYLFTNVNAALVECGNDINNPCTYDDFIALAGKIVNFMLYNIALPLSVLMIVFGGWLILSSNGNENKVKKGKGIITATFVGIGIAFGAWLIVHTVIAVFFKT